MGMEWCHAVEVEMSKEAPRKTALSGCTDYGEVPNEGHGFSRAIKTGTPDGFSR
jgi:hypothetical protein